mgnify:CR=1 FL=1
MPPRELTALILASALITLDGTAVTVALAAIGRDLGVPFTVLQWIGNAPLLMLAALLLTSGTLADRYGRRRVMRVGLVVFGAASVMSITFISQTSADLFVDETAEVSGRQ